MKQRIDSDQLNELTKVQQKRLRERWKPVEGDYFYTWLNGEAFSFYIVVDSWTKGNSTILVDYRGADTFLDMEDCLPLLSIGQMIEILSQSSYGYPRIGFTDSDGNNKNKLGYVMSMSSKYRNYESQELCDALWEAVKAVI